MTPEGDIVELDRVDGMSWQPEKNDHFRVLGLGPASGPGFSR